MKVGNLVKRLDPPWGTENQLGLVIDLETIQYSPKVVKVQWLGSEYPPFMYKREALTVVSEGK